MRLSLQHFGSLLRCGRWRLKQRAPLHRGELLLGWRRRDGEQQRRDGFQYQWVGTLCCAERRKKSLQIQMLDLAATGMVVGVDVRSENSSLLSARTRARVNSKASRILVPVVLSVFAVALLACSYSAASSSRNVQLAETSSVGEQVLTAIAHVSSKSGKLHSEAAQLQAADNTIRQTLARDSVDSYQCQLPVPARPRLVSFHWQEGLCLWHAQCF